MWTRGARESALRALGGPWDIIVVGGGITGAGVLLEATRRGLRALLVDAQDFAAGSSSRSTKLVHGGLRYLRQGDIGLTRASVHERDRLLRALPGLVEPLEFCLASYAGDRTPPWVFGLGLAIYDTLAGRWRHERLDGESLAERVPSLLGSGVKSGYVYQDAQTDDARLVLRLLASAVEQGATAVNYVRARDVLRTRRGYIAGVVLEDVAPDSSSASWPSGGSTREAFAPFVVNATGVWADELRAAVGARPRLRPIRGSHLVFPRAKLPLDQAVSLLHPADGRAVFALPWEGVTLVGTTDVEHREDLWREPRIEPREIDYLLALVRHAFPRQQLTHDDVQATWAGVRSVIGGARGRGPADPSKASRDHGVFREEGLVTVTGGKLTTFHTMALEALRGVLQSNPAADLDFRPSHAPWQERATLHTLTRESPALYTRLFGRYGTEASALLEAARRNEGLARIEGTNALWSELRWAAREEAVVHLDDLLLRRVRLGLLLPLPALVALLPRIRSTVQGELGWDDARWVKEEAGYLARWNAAYAPSPTRDGPRSTARAAPLPV